MSALEKMAPQVSITQDSLAQQKLWEAASKGDSAMIRILAMSGVDIDARNEDGLTAFSLATQNNHADTAMAILAAREMQYLRSIGVELGQAAASLEAAKQSGDNRKAG